MREYKMSLQEEKVISKIICNHCGRKIPLEKEEYFHAEKTWGYFSQKDGRQDDFDLCEGCYDALIQNFQVKMK